VKCRSRSEIVRSILEAANAGEGASKTRLMYKSYLSYNQLKEYLALLQENGLIDYETGKRCYIFFIFLNFGTISKSNLSAT
jgi:predicted transcriptional regulator